MKSESKMSVIFSRWCFFLVQIGFSLMMFAVISNRFSVAESTSNPESLSDVTSAPSTLLPSLSTMSATIIPMASAIADVTTASEEATTILPTTVTTTALPTNVATTALPTNVATTALPTNVTTTALPTTVTTTALPTTVTTTALPTNVTTTALPTTTTSMPSDPTDLIVSSVNPEGLNVTWTHLSGSTTYYEVLVNYTESLNTTSNHCFLDNLTGGTFYVIGVKACIQNKDCSNATEGSNTTYPSVPRTLQLWNRADSSFAINWTQFGGFSHFVVTVDYDKKQNITSDIIIEPSIYNGSFAVVNCWIGGLPVPGGNYIIFVSAVINHMQSDFQNSSFLTKPAQPQNVSLPLRTVDMLRITWDQPGLFEYISWSVNDTNTRHGDILSPPVNNETCPPCHQEMYLNITDLATAGEMYSIELIANVANVTSDPLNVNHSTVPYGPVNFSSMTGNSESINLSWKKPVGNLQFYELFYTNGSAEDTKTLSAENVTHTLSGLSSDSKYSIKLQTLSFGQSSDNETTSSWTLSDNVSDVNASRHDHSLEIFWKPPLRNANVYLYTLNIAYANECFLLVNLFCQTISPYRVNGTCSSTVNEIVSTCKNKTMSYTFKNLEPSTTYNITIAAVNPGGRSLPAVASFATIAVIAQETYEWVAGVVIGCLLAILLIIAIIMLLLRWRQEKPPFKGKNRSPSISYKGGEENPTYEEEPEPVAVKAFVNYAKKMSQDSNYLYACEYMLLAKLSPKNPMVAAELPDNRSKNRYTDILPYDNSRVKLVLEEDLDEGDCSDYINASFMPGFNSKREYIAAQGPMISTLDSFWLMIWQQKVSIVVMVTNLTERGREKCEQYWPDDDKPICYGSINVLLKSESPQDFYTIRALEVSFGSERRQIFQYHFLTWPDFGVPEDMEHILTFVKDIRNSIKGSAPVLVHCSAGVGRTGTFIVVDHLLQLIKKEQWIDLFHLVLDLRQHRPKMIQAESQYVFAHECIKLAIEKGLHRSSLLNIVEDDEQANGDCLYMNASETTKDASLYANSSELREQSV